jgi:hypothetical protein
MTATLTGCTRRPRTWPQRRAFSSLGRLHGHEPVHLSGRSSQQEVRRDKLWPTAMGIWTDMMGFGTKRGAIGKGNDGSQGRGRVVLSVVCPIQQVGNKIDLTDKPDERHSESNAIARRGRKMPW